MLGSRVCLRRLRGAAPVPCPPVREGAGWPGGWQPWPLAARPVGWSRVVCLVAAAAPNPPESGTCLRARAVGGRAALRGDGSDGRRHEAGSTSARTSKRPQPAGAAPQSGPSAKARCGGRGRPRCRCHPQPCGGFHGWIAAFSVAVSCGSPGQECKTGRGAAPPPGGRNAFAALRPARPPCKRLPRCCCARTASAVAVTQ